MKTAKQKRPWARRGLALCVLALVGLEPARAAVPELRLEAGAALDVGGSLKPTAEGPWRGARLRFALPALGPLSLHLGGELSSVSGRRVAGSVPLDLERRSFFLGAGAAWPLGRRLELEIGASLGADLLQESFSPPGSGATIRTRTTGFGAGGAAGVSIALGGRWRVPLTLGFQRVRFAGPLQSVTSSQLGLAAGLAFRLGAQPR